MKVYIRNYEYDYEYPEDMKKILDYLNSHGKILVSGHCIETLYRDFSDEEYCAGWMGVDERRLAEFEDWLERYDR